MNVKSSRKGMSQYILQPPFSIVIFLFPGLRPDVTNQRCLNRQQRHVLIRVGSFMPEDSQGLEDSAVEYAPLL